MIYLKRSEVKEGNYYWAILREIPCGGFGSDCPVVPEIVFVRYEKYDFGAPARKTVCRQSTWYADGHVYPNHLMDFHFIEKIQMPKGVVAKWSIESDKAWKSHFDGDVNTVYDPGKPPAMKVSEIKKDTYYWAMLKERFKGDTNKPEIVEACQTDLKRLSIARNDNNTDEDTAFANHVRDWHFLEPLRLSKKIWAYFYAEREYWENKKD